MIKVELRNIRTNERFSVETDCFTARLVLDGVDVGEVRNDGRGGPDNFHPASGHSWDTYREAEKPVAADYPPVDLTDIGVPGETMAQSLESLCCDLVNDHITTRDLRRKMGRQILLFEPGPREVYGVKVAAIDAATIARIGAKYPTAGFSTCCRKIARSRSGVTPPSPRALGLGNGSRRKRRGAEATGEPASGSQIRGLRMITKFDKPTLQALRVEIDAGLAAVGAKHGLEIRLGHISYTAASFTAKVEASLPGAKAEHDASTLKRMAEVYGLEPGKVSMDGYELVGFLATRRSRPWLGRKNGKDYVFDLPGARMRWGKADAGGAEERAFANRAPV